MASIRSVFSQKGGKARIRQIAYARHETGRGVVQVDVSNAPRWVVKAILESDNPTALKIMRNYSQQGQMKIAGTQRANILEVLRENYILTPEEESEIQKLLDTMTSAEMDAWAQENKEIVRSFWEKYKTRRYETFMGPTEEDKNVMFREIVESMKARN